MSTSRAAIDGCPGCKQRTEGAFCSLPAETLTSLDKISYAVNYPEHAVLFSEGQPCNTVFLLCSGRAKLSSSSQDGKKVMLRVATAGQVLGISPALSGTHHTVTAETLSPAFVRVLKRDDFVHFVHSSAQTSLHVLGNLGTEYQTALDTLRSLAWFPTAAARIAQLLLQLCADENRAPNDEMRTKLLLTQEQIAQMTATSRETVTRLLGDLRRNRVIAIRGTDLVIRNREVLERMTC